MRLFNQRNSFRQIRTPVIRPATAFPENRPRRRWSIDPAVTDHDTTRLPPTRRRYAVKTGVIAVTPQTIDPTVTIELGYDTQRDAELSYDTQIDVELQHDDAMVPEQQISLIRATDNTIRARMRTPRDITGWAISFTVATALGAAASITKTVGAGITITDGPSGIITITLAKSDTQSLTAGGYVWDVTRTDSGSRVCLARGELLLEQEVTAQ